MADFGGFQMPLPQDVLAEREQQRQQLYTQGNINQQRRGTIEMGINSLFGTPQMRQAKRVETGINHATQAVGKPQPGEDPNDFEMRRLSAMRDAISDIDPSTASQINMKLLQLGEQKFQRDRLKASDEREKTVYDLNLPGLKDAAKQRAVLGGGMYLLDTKEGTAELYNINDPTDTARFEEDRKKPGKLVLTPAQQYELYHDTSVAALKIRGAIANSGLGKNAYNVVERASAGLYDVYAVADRFLQTLEANPDALTAGSKGAQKFDQMLDQTAAAARMLAGDTTHDNAGNEITLDSWLETNNITNERAKSAIISIAAAQAKANNPDGRISNQDMTLALQQVGGNNPNPLAILSNLNDSLERSSSAIFSRIDTIPEMKTAFAERRKDLGTKHDAWRARFGKFVGQGAAKPTGFEYQTPGSAASASGAKAFDPATASPEELMQWSQETPK